MADLQAELKESIAYFEQILNVLPGDRTALEFLSVAYAQLGDAEKSLTYTIALSEVVLREKDAQSAAELIEKLKTSGDARSQATVLRLQVLVGPKPELKFEKPELCLTAASPSVAAKAELALLKRLVSDGVLSESMTRQAFEQLETMPSNDGDFLISALLILEKENLTGAADAVVAVADAAHAPPVPLDSFDFDPSYARRLPERLVRVRGVFPFAKLGEEWAVAVLNPLDDELRAEVAATLGAKCHFFLAPPAVAEKTLERIFASNGSEGESPAVPAPVADEPPVMTRPLGERGLPR